MIIPIFKSETGDQIPNDFFTFFSKHIYSYNWNDYLFTYIITKKKLKKNFSLTKRITNQIKSKKKINFVNFFKFSNRLLISALNYIFFPRVRNQPLVFFNTYLSFKKKISLIFRNFCFPIQVDKSKKNVQPNIDLRKSFVKGSRINNFFDDILNFSILNLPSDYLENFSNIGNATCGLNVPKNPKVIFTANGIYPSSFASRYIAECVSKGTKLILAQHGGRYENIKYFFHTDFEVDISDYFLSWGSKKKNNKIKNLGIIKPFKKIGKNKEANNKILFLMMAKGRYSRNIDTEINIKNLYNYYKNICPGFYFSLKNKLKKNLVYRSSSNNYWSEKELLAQKCKLSIIDFNRHKSDFFKVAESSKIVVCSYLSTTFMELMSANKPVILFTPFPYESYNSLTIKSFNLMKKNKIFFETHIQAANFLNDNWERIDDWWYSTKVQNSRKNFLKNFAFENSSQINDIQNLINSCKNAY